MNELLTQLGVIAGGLVALGVIWKMGFVPIYRLIRKMEDIHEIIVELPDWRTKVDRDLLQLHFNGGGSLKDLAKATQSDVACLAESTQGDVANLREDVDTLRILIEEHINSSEPHQVRIDIHSDADSF